MAMHASVVIVCLKSLANPDATWPSLLDFGVILWSFCIIHTGTVLGRTFRSRGAISDLWWAWSVGRTLGIEFTRDLAPKAARHNQRCRQLVPVGVKFHPPPPPFPPPFHVKESTYKEVN